MKLKIQRTALLLLIVSLTTLAAYGLASNKKYKVEGTQEEWSNVLNVVDQSDASNRERKAARELILNQVIPQISDTTK